MILPARYERKENMKDEDVRYRLKKHEPIGGKWNIDSMLGKGSQGTVYRAHDKNNPDNIAALKVISLGEEEAYAPDLEQTICWSVKGEHWQKRKKTVLQEIEILQKFKNCRYIVNMEETYEFSWDNGKGMDIVIQLEYLTPVKQYFRDYGLSEKELLKVAKDICNALICIQKEKLVHGDIKLDNLYRSKEGVYKLGDFGISQTVGLKSYNGTALYLAPETLRTGEKSFATDIYALGILLYLLVGGSKEGAGNHVFEKKTLKVNNVGKDFAKIISKACETDKNKRIANAAIMLECLQAIERPSEKKIQFIDDKDCEKQKTTAGIKLEYTVDSISENNEKNSKENFGYKLLNWFFSSCVLAVMPLTIYILFTRCFNVNESSTKFITEMLYFGLTISITTVRDLIDLKVEWRKYKSAYILILSILFIIIILTAVFFGIMTAYDMGIFNSKINKVYMRIMTEIMVVVSFAIGIYVQYLEVE